MYGRSPFLGMVTSALLSAAMTGTPAVAATPDDLTVLTDFGGQDLAYAMAVQADGKVVSAGLTSTDGEYRVAMARHDPDGSLDATFGAGGKVVTDIGDHRYSLVRALSLQSDGKIVAAGATDQDGRTVLALLRYNVDGRLDATFGTGGVALADVGGQAYGVTMQPDGKIVAAGSADADSVLVRYDAAGRPDRTFGAGGVVSTDLGGADETRAVAVQPDGRIVTTGVAQVRADTDFATARYTTDGALDTSFGDGGVVITDVRRAESDDDARDLAVQPEGSIVAAGASAAGRGTNDDFALVRYRSDGSLDPAFGDDGMVVTDIGHGSTDKALAVTLQPDHRIVAAGVSGLPRLGDFALARYGGDGRLDVTFGDGGTIVTDVTGGTADDEAFAVAAVTDHTVLAVGVCRVGNSDFAMVRYRT
ncbi:delta-60 repeat domain-containing protein [Actinoplanes sp. NPDC049316]|uniref:delta-60 repeat domain-containing protein n=1 Tax=Actinoplanes sp. NPDC049316 TaxID=3154727 RepID=UPI00342312B0